MTRSLRYPRLTVFFAAATIFCALWRDFCVEDGLLGAADVLLLLTLLLLVICFTLISCRFFVDDHGVGVGCLFHVRRSDWHELSTLGVLCCNSRRPYLYGLYTGETDFIRLLNHAPFCGDWGFVVPLNRRLVHAVAIHCPFEVDLSPIPKRRAPGRLRPLWRAVALDALLSCVLAAILFVQSALSFFAASANTGLPAQLATTLSLAFFLCGLVAARRVLVAVGTCPCLCPEGLAAGRSLFIDWPSIRFGYLKRARLSAVYLLSERPELLAVPGAPPVYCFSLPDSRVMMLACQQNCRKAELRNFDFA